MSNDLALIGLVVLVGVASAGRWCLHQFGVHRYCHHIRRRPLQVHDYAGSPNQCDTHDSYTCPRVHP